MVGRPKNPTKPTGCKSTKYSVIGKITRGLYSTVDNFECMMMIKHIILFQNRHLFQTRNHHYFIQFDLTYCNTFCTCCITIISLDDPKFTLSVKHLQNVLRFTIEFMHTLYALSFSWHFKPFCCQSSRLFPRRIKFTLKDF